MAIYQPFSAKKKVRIRNLPIKIAASHWTLGKKLAILEVIQTAVIVKEVTKILLAAIFHIDFSSSLTLILIHMLL